MDFKIDKRKMAADSARRAQTNRVPRLSMSGEKR